MPLIREHGLKVFGRVWSDDDVEAYIIVVVKTTLEDGSNKVVIMREVSR